MVKSINFDDIFNELITVIMESKFGATITLIGGVETLAPLKEPISNKLKEILKRLHDDGLNSNLNDENISQILNYVEHTSTLVL